MSDDDSDTNQPENRSAPAPRPEPLFSVDLGANGGVFAPTDGAELREWVEREHGFWAWINNIGNGVHEQGVRHAFNQLSQVFEISRRLSEGADLGTEHSRSEISDVRSRLENVFVERGGSPLALPHSSSSRGKRIAMFRREHGDLAASYFAAVYLPPPQGYSFQPQDLGQWRGLVEGLIERFDLANTVGFERLNAEDLSLDELRSKMESLLGEKTAAYDALHRRYDELARSIQTSAETQATDFERQQSMRHGEFQGLVKDHLDGMEILRKTFREEIAMRAPVSYWARKRTYHVVLAGITGLLSFGGIAAAAVLLRDQIHELLGATKVGSSPDTWRVAMLGLMALFAVWAIRLVVRMFLSHVHLSADAAERVVMVRTYLSLLEGNHAGIKEDRQLILQALFRPASDGIVKDEGLPVSVFELLTRQGKG